MASATVLFNLVIVVALLLFLTVTTSVSASRLDQLQCQNEAERKQAYNSSRLAAIVSGVSFALTGIALLLIVGAKSDRLRTRVA